MEKHVRTSTQKDFIDRIARIEGQLRGVRVMVEEGRECIDIITQISAVRQALAGMGAELLKADARCKKLDENYIKALFKIN